MASKVYELGYFMLNNTSEMLSKVYSLALQTTVSLQSQSQFSVKLMSLATPHIHSYPLYIYTCGSFKHSPSNT